MSRPSELRRSFQTALCLSLIAAAGAAMAQSASPASQAAPPAMAASTAANSQSMHTTPKAIYHTKQGTLIIKSTVPAQRHYGPAPDFAKLDVNHDGHLSSDEADAYVPLANDFLYVSHGATTISRGQYTRWVKQRSTSS